MQKSHSQVFVLFFFFLPTFKDCNCPPDFGGRSSGGSSGEKTLKHEGLTQPQWLLGVVVISSPTQIVFSGPAPQHSNAPHDTSSCSPIPALPAYTSWGQQDPPTLIPTGQPRGCSGCKSCWVWPECFSFLSHPSPLTEFPWKQKQSSSCLGLVGFFSSSLGEGV